MSLRSRLNQRPVRRLAEWFLIRQRLRAQTLRNKLPLPSRSLSIHVSSSPITHWIMIMQENRSFDHYFMGYPGANTKLQSKSFHLSSETINCCNHGDEPAAKDWNNGAMKEDDFIASEKSIDTMGYYNNSDAGVSDYWNLAGNFTLFDNLYSTWMGWSFPNHFLNIAASDVDPRLGDIGNSTPDKVPDYSLSFINVCDLLTAANISWRYYGGTSQEKEGSAWSLWSSLHYFKNFQYYSEYEMPNVNVFGDIDAITDEIQWPAVTWIIPPGSNTVPQYPCVSEHPPCPPSLGWKHWVSPIISKIMAKNDAALGTGRGLWEKCAILITWDDYGGYYDHVAPPSVQNSPVPPPTAQSAISGQPTTYYYGFRVPGILVSPFSKPGFIDHTQYDFTSFLKTIEANWRLRSLNGLDRFANDFLSYSPFDFKQKLIDGVSTSSFHSDHARVQFPMRLEREQYTHVSTPAGEEVEND